MATRGRRRTSARCRRAAARLCLGRSVPAATATSDAPGDGAPSGFTRTLRWEWGAVRLSGVARDGRREEPRDTKPGTWPALRTEHSQSSKGPQAHTWPRPSELRDRGHSVLTRHLLHRVAVRSRSVTTCKAFEVAAGHSHHPQQVPHRSRHRLFLERPKRPILTTFRALHSSLHSRSMCRPKRMNGISRGTFRGCTQDAGTASVPLV